MKVYHTKDLKTSAGKEILEEHYKSLGHITGKEKRGIILVLILLVYLCSTRITGLPAAYGFMVISVLVFLPGIGIGNEGTVKKINFTTVFPYINCGTCITGKRNVVCMSGIYHYRNDRKSFYDAVCDARRFVTPICADGSFIGNESGYSMYVASVLLRSIVLPI